MGSTQPNPLQPLNQTQPTSWAGQLCFFRAARSSALHQEKPTHEDSLEIFLILVLHGHEPARLPPRHQWGENVTVAPNASLDSGGRQHGPSNDVSRPMTPESRRRERDCWGPPGSSSRGCTMLAPSQCYPLKSWPQTPDLTAISVKDQGQGALHELLLSFVLGHAGAAPRPGCSWPSPSPRHPRGCSTSTCRQAHSVIALR